MNGSKNPSNVQKIASDLQKSERDFKCFKCNGLGHMAFQCPLKNKFQNFSQRRNDTNQKIKCAKCLKLGHPSSRCWSGNKRPFSENNERQLAKPYKRFKPNSVRSIQDQDAIEEDAKIDDQGNFVLSINEDEEKIVCDIAGMQIQMVIDSGSKYNMVDEISWHHLQNQSDGLMNIRSVTDKVFKAFASQVPLKVRAVFEAKIKVRNSSEDGLMATFYVIEKAESSLLGKETSLKLGVLRIGLPLHVNEVQRIKVPFPKIKDVVVEISVDPNVKPVIQPLRRAPIPLQDKINDKLQELLDLEIIEPARGPITWQSPLVPIIKENGDLRLCVDMRRANQAILRENHPLPRFEDFLPLINNAKIFSRLDVKNAFHQLELKECSRYITTFISSKGVFRYKRLMFGVNCAPEIFQKVLERILVSCEGCFNYIDDIIIFGTNIDDHDRKLRVVLDTLKNYNVELNSSKCLFGVEELVFLGHHLSRNGVKPSADKIESIRSFRAPQNCDELSSFLGLVTYIGRFIPHLATKTVELRELLKQTVKFEWLPKHEECFKDLKKSIGQIDSLGYFDPKDRTQVIADASPWGLGSVLVQIKDGTHRVISYASKSLTDTEKRYCQTEKEALALVWAVERFSTYLIGLEFDLITDHRPLETIFAPKSKPCARIERWVLRLQSFRYNVIYKAGKQNIADPFSRLSTNPITTEFDEDCEQYIRAITEAAALDIDEILKATTDDQELSDLRNAIESNDFKKISDDFKPFQLEFCVANGLILRGTKVVIPKSLQKRILEIAHEGHPGETKMKQRLRNRVWFPKMDKLVINWVKACRGCLMVSAPSAPEPMKRRNLPNRPWNDVALDFLGPLPSSEYLMVIVDYFSRYMEIEVMTTITAKETIIRLAKIFCRLGFPKTISCDNGKQFVSDEFREYCNNNSIHLNFSAPYWPQENGEVERQNRSLLKRLKISQIYQRNWKTDLNHYLSMYYTTPHCTTGKAPAEMLYGRPIRDKLPLIISEDDFTLDSDVRDRDLQNKYKNKMIVDRARLAKENNLKVGDVVLRKNMVRENKLSPNFSGEEYTITDKTGAKCVIENKAGKQFVRNSSHLKRVDDPVETSQFGGSSILQQTKDNERPVLNSPSGLSLSSDDHLVFGDTVSGDATTVSGDAISGETESVDVLPPGLNKPHRLRGPPKRLEDYVLSNQFMKKREM